MKYLLLLLPVLLFGSGSASTDVIVPTGGICPSKENKQIVREFYKSFEQKRYELLTSCLAPNCKVVDCSTPYQTEYSKHTIISKNLTTRYKAFQEAFASLTVHLGTMIAEGRLVFAQVTFSGEQKGELFGSLPTSKPVCLKAFAIFTIEDGKITKIQEMWNELSVMKQIGHIAL